MGSGSCLFAQVVEQLDLDQALLVEALPAADDLDRNGPARLVVMAFEHLLAHVRRLRACKQCRKGQGPSGMHHILR